MSNLFSGWFRREATQGVPNSTADKSAQVVAGVEWKERVVTPTGRKSLVVPAWFRGVSLIMQTMGQMRVQYQRMNGEGGNFIEDRYGDARRLNWLLQVKPNPLMTASQMQEQIEFRKIYHGNAYVYIERNGSGWPLALWLCTGGGYNPLTDTYQLTYNRENHPAVFIEANSEDVLHFKNTFMTDDYFMGVPTIVYAMKTLSIAATADEQTLKDMAKGGKHKIILQEEKSPTLGTRGRANKDQLRKVAQDFANDWDGGDVVLLDNVSSPTIISQTASELRMLESRGFEVSDIARILGIPRIMMMEDQGSSYKMPEHATQEFLLRTIQPRIRSCEDEYNSKLLNEYDFGKRRIHVCELALRRLDAKGQAEIDKLHLEAGWSVNELRAQYDLPNIPEGNAHYVSTNLAEVGSEKLRSNGGGRPAEATVTNNDSQEGEGGEE